MSRKLLAAMIAVMLLATAVGIGVHLMHKDARADVNYTIQVKVWNEAAEAWAVGGVQYNVNFDFGAPVGDFNEVTNAMTGIATHTLDNGTGNPWDATFIHNDPFIVWSNADRLIESDNPFTVPGSQVSHIFWIEFVE